MYDINSKIFFTFYTDKSEFSRFNYGKVYPEQTG